MSFFDISQWFRNAYVNTYVIPDSTAIAEYKSKYEEGRARSKELLQQNLSPAQNRNVMLYGYFDVTGSDGGEYRIRTDQCINNVIKIVKGYSAERLCVHIDDDYHCPLFDHLLAQKLMLEADEKEFRRTAFKSPLTLCW